MTLMVPLHELDIVAWVYADDGRMLGPVGPVRSRILSASQDQWKIRLEFELHMMLDGPQAFVRSANVRILNSLRRHPIPHAWLHYGDMLTVTYDMRFRWEDQGVAEPAPQLVEPRRNLLTRVLSGRQRHA